MAHSVKHDAAFWDERLGTVDGVAHWHFYAYEYLDDLAFMPRARDVLRDWPQAEAVIAAVEARFRQMNWDGDGQMQVMWLPPFVGAGPHDWFGCYSFHVKQTEDGISWIASPSVLPFHRLFQPDDAKFPQPGQSAWEPGSLRQGAVRWLSDLDGSAGEG
jgi:hypothetical protein